MALWLVHGLLSLGSCRALNPRFLEPADQATTRGDEGPVNETTGAVPPDPGATHEDEETAGDSSTQGATRPPLGSSGSSGSTESSPGSMTTSTAPLEPWSTVAPAPITPSNPALPCTHGAKGCFLFDDSAATQLSGGQYLDHPEMFLSLRNVGVGRPLSEAQKTELVASFPGGVGFDEQNSRVRSSVPYPFYREQDFGVEMWYTRNSPYVSGVDDIMLLHVPGILELVESRENGGVTCRIISSQGEIPRETKVQPTNPEDLRYIACFVFQNSVFLYTSGEWSSVGPQGANEEMSVDAKLKSHQRTPGFSVGGRFESEPVLTPSCCTRLDGTVYMVRVWNNIRYLVEGIDTMRKALGLGVQDPKDKLWEIRERLNQFP